MTDDLKALFDNMEGKPTYQPSETPFPIRIMAPEDFLANQEAAKAALHGEVVPRRPFPNDIEFDGVGVKLERPAAKPVATLAESDEALVASFDLPLMGDEKRLAAREDDVKTTTEETWKALEQMSDEAKEAIIARDRRLADKVAILAGYGPDSPEKPAKPRRTPAKPRAEKPVVAEPDWTWRTKRMDALMAAHEDCVPAYHECIGDFERQQMIRIDALDEQRLAKRTMDQMRDDVLLSGVVDGKNEAIRSAQLDAALAKNGTYQLAESDYRQADLRANSADMGTTIALKRIKALEMQHGLLTAQLEVLAR